MLGSWFNVEVHVPSSIFVIKTVYKYNQSMLRELTGEQFLSGLDLSVNLNAYNDSPSRPSFVRDWCSELMHIT